jgi:nitroreductase
MFETDLSSIHSLIAQRRSSRMMDADRPIPSAQVEQILKAACWAPSSNNQQPWRYLVFNEDHPQALQTARQCLSASNQIWANRAPLLILALAEKTRPDGRPNPKALHDLGLANENLLLQATALGLNCRPMGGFDLECVRLAFHIPDQFEPVIIIAIGYPAPADQLPEEIQQKERQPRQRRSLQSTVFYGQWPEEP